MVDALELMTLSVPAHAQGRYGFVASEPERFAPPAKGVFVDAFDVHDMDGRIVADDRLDEFDGAPVRVGCIEVGDDGRKVARDVCLVDIVIPDTPFG